MKTGLAALLSVVSLLAVCVPMSAHHGNVAYDETKIVVVKDAKVTKFMWTNPHCLILFDANDEKGNVLHWAVEGGSPSALTPAGWTRNSVKPGDVITVYLHQSKAGTPVGRETKVVLADGTELSDR